MKTNAISAGTSCRYICTTAHFMVSRGRPCISSLQQECVPQLTQTSARRPCNRPEDKHPALRRLKMMSGQICDPNILLPLGALSKMEEEEDDDGDCNESHA